MKDGVTPLMIACFGRHNGVVQLLLEHADVTRRDNEKGFDALYVAAQKAMDNVVADLVSAGADVNGKTKDGFTPLHISAYYRSAAMLSLLLALGADANEPIESDGSTALAIAAWNGSAKCVEVLLPSSSVHLKLKVRSRELCLCRSTPYASWSASGVSCTYWLWCVCWILRFSRMEHR